MLKRAVVIPLLALLAATPGFAQTGTPGATPKADPPPASAPGASGSAPKATPKANGQLIVGLKPGVTKEQATALWKSFNVKVVEKVANQESYVIAVPAGRLDRVEKGLKARAEVEYVERNVKHSPAPGPKS